MFYNEKSDYKSYFPEIFKNVVEIDGLDKSINIQFDKLNALIKKSIDNKSVQFADEQGVARWEKMLGVSSPLNSTLSSRREALKSKLMTKPPINMLTLKGIIEAYMGITVSITVRDYTVKVKYRGTAKISDLKPLYATVYDTIPANLILDIIYAYLTFNELDSLKLTFSTLDAKKLNWNDFEKGEWI